MHTRYINPTTNPCEIRLQSQGLRKGVPSDTRRYDGLPEHGTSSVPSQHIVSNPKLSSIVFERKMRSGAHNSTISHIQNDNIQCP